MALTYVVAYARFSSDNQREESIDAQLRAIRQYCQQHDYILLDTYVDEARSATTDDRPAFQQMIKDSAAGDWSAVIVHKLDRFSRNRYDSAIYKKQLKDNGVHVESVLERLDDSPESVILESLLEGMSEYYSKNLAREVLKGKHETALQCKHNGGQPPLGLQVDKDGTYSINEHEAETVRLIFSLTAGGHSQNEVCHIINEKGHRTRHGNKFTQTSINVILHNEKYNGTYVYGRTVPQPKGRRTNASRPDDEILRIPNGIPAIVDARTFNDVQEILARRKSQSTRGSGGAVEVYLLQGLIKCGNCGSAMVGSRNHCGRSKNLRVVYECNGRKRKTTDCKMRSINRDFVEDLVIDYIEKYILSDTAMAKVKELLTKEIQDQQNESPAALINLKKELTTTEAALDKLIDAIISGIDAGRVKTRIDELEAKRARLESQISIEESRQQSLGNLDLEGLDEYLAHYRNIRSHPRKAQKEIINKFVNQILIYDNDENGDKIVLELKLPSKTIHLAKKRIPNDTIQLHGQYARYVLHLR